jgi:hypothetical protein
MPITKTRIISVTNHSTKPSMIASPSMSWRYDSYGIAPAHWPDRKGHRPCLTV